MDKLKESIDIIKNKIINAIESFGYYKEFKYVKDILLNELNSYKYNENDEMSLKKYYGWLQEFYEGRIGVINRSIMYNQNNSVFDNVTEDQIKKINELISKIEKNDYHNKILGMTLNTSNEDIIDIMNYVQKNNFHEEEFYNNLYVLIEKEKYIANRFYSEIKLYYLLNEKAKNIIERMLIDNLKNYDENITTEIIDRLKKYGFLKVIDKKLEEFFDKQKYNNEQFIDYISREYRIVLREADRDIDIHDWINRTERYRGNIRLFGKDQYEQSFPPLKANSDFNKEKIIKLSNVITIEDNQDWLFVFYDDRAYNYKRMGIVYKTGEKFGFPDNKKRPGKLDYQLGYFMKYDKDVKRLTIYRNIEKKLLHDKVLTSTIDHVRRYVADYRKNNFLIMYDNYKIEVYDQDFNLINTIKLDDAWDITFANDGVATLIAKDERTIIYYDYINMKIIDSFTIGEVNSFLNKIYVYYSNIVRHPFVYSEGVYNYFDNCLFGYKDINGNVVIEPTFKLAGPFLGHIAWVNNGNGQLILNRAGEAKPWISELHNKNENYIKACQIWNGNFAHDSKLKPDLKEGKYRLQFEIDGSALFRSNDQIYNRGYLLAKDHYLIDLDIPIMDIDFESKEKVLKK